MPISLLFNAKNWPKVCGLVPGRQTSDRCLLHAWLAWLHIAEPFLYLCYMRRVSYASKGGMERLYYYQIKTRKKNKQLLSNVMLHCAIFSEEIFYQNLLSSTWQLWMWKSLADTKEEKKHRNIASTEFIPTDLWWMWLKIPLENQMKKHVLWNQEKKTLYISLLGPAHITI